MAIADHGEGRTIKRRMLNKGESYPMPLLIIQYLAI
jgi:hypothetical protein